MKTLRIAAAPLIMALALAGCSGDDDVTTAPTTSAPTTQSSPTESSTSSTSSTSSDSSSTSESSSDTSSSSDTASSSDTSTEESGTKSFTKKFGETVTWENGFAMTAGKPVKFTPRKDALGMEGYKNAVKITYTVKNGTKEPFDPSLHPDGTSGTRAIEQIFDSTNDCGGAPSSTMLPGRTLVFTECYAVDDVNDITISARPSYDAEEAFWASK